MPEQAYLNVLFLKYINDLPQARKLFTCIMYVDDSAVSSSVQLFRSRETNEAADVLINKKTK